MFTPNGNSNFSVNTTPPTNQGSLPLVVIDENEGSAIANDVRPSGPDAETIIDYSKKLQDDLQALAEKIKLHEENIKAWRTEKDELNDSILEKQVTLGKYYSSTPASTRNDSSSYTGVEEKILCHGESAADILCQLKKHSSSISPLASNKDILGVVATLGRVDDVNLSRLLSEYVGVETMLAIVCKAGAGVKALEDYNKDGAIDKNAGIHGFSAYMGKALTGRFLVLSLENLRPYVGGFVSEDPQRKLRIPKPRLPNGECPPGFLGFAVNMIDMDATHLLCLTPCGYGLRETLFYHLFSRTQVYRTRAEMLSARPLISEGAISLDGGIIRSSGVDLLGNRQDVDVHFPSASAAPESPANYPELQEKVTNLKSRREKVLEDLQKERQLLDHVKLNFEQKKQEFVKFMACSSAYAAQMDPGPIDASVLSGQDNHRSSVVWDTNPEYNECLTCRRVEGRLRRGFAGIPTHPRMIDYLASSGFLGVSKIPFIQLDWHLITALVERWRPETHSFHLVVGEVSITLQDISVQFGLPIDGPPVTGTMSDDWTMVCTVYLGLPPPTRDLDGGRLKLSTIDMMIGELENDAEDAQVIFATRAYILKLMGGLLFSDKSGNRVHLMFLPLLENLEMETPYSWGSAVLAWLYRQLCQASRKDAHEISGALLLVQLWAWDRLPYISPIRRDLPLLEGAPFAARWGVMKDVTQTSTHVVSQYRIMLDRQTPNEFVWEPYTEDILESLPYYCTAESEIWTAKVPLICFHIVEWHLPDRVMRQFGGIQGIPDICNTEVDLHKIDLRNKTDAGWNRRHKKYVRLWRHRHESLLQVITGPVNVQPDYYDWYRMHTRRWISRTGATLSYLIEKMHDIRLMARNENVVSIERMATDALTNTGIL